MSGWGLGEIQIYLGISNYKTLCDFLTLNSFALLMTLFAGSEVVLIAALSVVQELCADAVMAAVEEATGFLISTSSVRIQLAVVRIEASLLLWLSFSLTFSLTILSRIGSGFNLRLFLLRLIALSRALVLLLEIVSVSVTASVVELPTTRLCRVVVPTSSVVLARTQVSGKFASVFD